LKMTIRLLIADDHSVVRAGLRGLLLAAGLDVVGEAVTGREAVALAQSLRPHVILMDVRMPEMDGLQALTAIKAKMPEISIVMLTVYASTEYLSRAIAAGAAGYLLKDAEPEEIVRVVRAAAQGDRVIDATLLQSVLENTQVAESSALQRADLTQQELRVLKLIALGLNNDALAETLVISRNTVKTHVRHIFEKLMVSDRTQAAIWAVRNGLVE
jgi:DNA-binding NarL/FixJ family response regulator